MFFLLAYDITDQKRLVRMSELCKDFGFTRVQKSVFAGECDADTLTKYLTKAQALVDCSSDSLLIVPLCKTCMNHHHHIGTARPLHACLDKAFLLIQ